MRRNISSPTGVSQASLYSAICAAQRSRASRRGSHAHRHRHAQLSAPPRGFGGDRPPTRTQLARQHDVVVVSTAWEAPSGVTTEDGATVHRLAAWHGAERRGVPYAMPLGPGTLHAISALRSCDVLHAHRQPLSDDAARAAGAASGSPNVHHGTRWFRALCTQTLNALQQVAWTTIGAPIVRRSAKVVAYNSRVRDWLAARFGDDAVAFIANGVDTTTFSPRNPDERLRARARLGLPARGSPGAVCRTRRTEEKPGRRAAGTGRAAYRLVVCGARRALGGGVLDLGAVPYAAMPDVFAAADFLLHAATGEGFPVTVQEAMASGLPVALLWDSGYVGSVKPRRTRRRRLARRPWTSCGQARGRTRASSGARPSVTGICPAELELGLDGRALPDILSG